MFLNNNQGFQRPPGGFRPQPQQAFRPQQQQSFIPQQQPGSQGLFQFQEVQQTPESVQTTVQVTASPSTPAPESRVSESSPGSSPVSASTTTFSTRAPSPAFSSVSVSAVSSSLAPATRAPTVLLPSTRQPRVLPVNNNNFGSSSISSFGSSSGSSFGSSSGSSFGSSSGSSFGSSSSGSSFGSSSRTQEPRGGRAHHSAEYTAPAAPEPAYSPPAADYGHKPSYKILKLTGLDTAPIPNFNYMYSTENKINVMAEGELRNVCNEDVTVMRGSYDYYGPDGVKYTVDWYADETGDVLLITGSM